MIEQYKGIIIESFENEINGNFSQDDELYISLNKHLYHYSKETLEPVYSFDSTTLSAKTKWSLPTCKLSNPFGFNKLFVFKTHEEK